MVTTLIINTPYSYLILGFQGGYCQCWILLLGICIVRMVWTYMLPPKLQHDCPHPQRANNQQNGVPIFGAEYEDGGSISIHIHIVQLPKGRNNITYLLLLVVCLYVGNFMPCNNSH